MTCNRVKKMTRDQFMKEARRRQKCRPDYRLRERFVEDHGLGSFNDAEILTMYVRLTR